MKSPIWIASDHAGVTLKAQLIEAFPELNWKDLGPSSEKQSVDYPDYAEKLCKEMLAALPKQPEARGVLICGSGIGMSIAANRFAPIRAALCMSPELGRLSREHNNSNVLCLGARFTPADEAKEILRVWLKTPFAAGSRHETRVSKLSQCGNS